MANGSKLGESNALSLPADTLVVLFPRKSLLLKNTVTSGILKQPAMISEPMKLSLPSLRVSKIGIW